MKPGYAPLLAALFALTACASPIIPIPYKGPNGRQAYTMRCSGEGRTMEMCNSKAARLCPKGYDTLPEKELKPNPQAKAAGIVEDLPQARLSIECK